MKITVLRLENFRNYERQEIEFNGNLNFLYGENAQGKTNVLEAVFLCSTGRSHRTQKDAEMVRFGESAAVAEVCFERENLGEVTIEITIQRTGRKAIRVNGVPLRRAGDLLGMLNCVIFSPEDLAIVKDEPQVRRRFLDMFISQIRPMYYFNLHRYNQVLRQRNALLKQAREDRSALATIEAWNEPLAELGARIMLERAAYSDMLGGHTKKNHALITGGREEIRVSYAPSIKAAGDAAAAGNMATAGSAAITDDTESNERNASTDMGRNALTAMERNASTDDMRRNAAADMLRVAFLDALARSTATDVARMSTQCGPHKDEISFTLDGKNLRLYGSQGQQRTVALALKMAQVDVMTAETGDVPVLLLDDVMSELDRGRQENLSVNMKMAQTFMTGTSRGEFRRDGENFFHVLAGHVATE